MIQKPEPMLSLLQQCHCGSGRKYKRCCWQRERPATAIASRAIRDLSHIALGFAEDCFPDLIQEVNDEFFLPAAAALGEEEVRRLAE